MKASIVILAGDGIGPEVTHEGVRVLQAIASRFGHDFKFEAHLIGGDAIDQTKSPLPASTLSACGTADAVLLGAVGGPKWSDPKAEVRPEQRTDRKSLVSSRAFVFLSGRFSLTLAACLLYRAQDISFPAAPRWH